MKWYELGAVVLVLGLILKSRHEDSGERPMVETRKEILDAFEARGYPAREADAVIRIESGWKPNALHPKTKATGLLQFLPRFLPSIGWTAGPEAFAQLTIAEQLPWIKRHLSRAPHGSGIPGDTYVLAAAPSYVGMPDDVVVYAVNSPAWKQNPGWHDPGEPVTVGSLRRVLLGRLAR